MTRFQLIQRLTRINPRLSRRDIDQVVSTIFKELRGGTTRNFGNFSPKRSGLRVESPEPAKGRRGRLQILNAESESFGDDLERAFKKNVSKVRRENKRLLGSPDIAPSES
jgi:hypothetical protein